MNWPKTGLASLSDIEGPGCCLDNDLSSQEVVLAANFMTKRALNIDSIAKTFTPLWWSRNGFKIRNIGDHRILFVFDDKSKVENIIHGEPWNFDKHLVVMEWYEVRNLVDTLKFDRTMFWVQVHGIPYKYMNVKVVEKICKVLGKVIHSIDPYETDGGNFMKVRVIMDISLPLCRGLVIALANGEKIWVSFKYECLPNIWYWCGCFDHDDKDCGL